jgi:regulator of sigma E protease
MLDFLQTAALYLIPFLLVLTLVVTIHELGHFYAAKACGVAIEQFSIGFGKAIITRRDKSGVEWRIGWIPLGGYVKFAGDANAASVPDQDDLEHMRQWIAEHDGPDGHLKYFHFKPIWQRAVISAAGPIANFLLAITLFAVLLMTVGEVTQVTRVSGVAPGSVAESAGFRAGDVILKADRHTLDGMADLKGYIALRAGVPVKFTINRGGAEIELTATPRPATITDPLGRPMKGGQLGVISQLRREDIKRTRYNPIAAIGMGAVRTWDVLDTTVYYLGRLVRGQISAEQLGGPIGIAQASGKVAEIGGEGAPDFGSWLLGAGVSLLGLAALLSVSVGFMNLLPIPVLDGGHLLFYAYEAVASRPLGAKAQAAGYRVGLALLLSFMLFATWNDLQRLRVFSFLGGLFS